MHRYFSYLFITRSTAEGIESEQIKATWAK